MTRRSKQPACRADPGRLAFYGFEMQYTGIKSDDYIADPEDTDWLLWGQAMCCVAALKPTDSWQNDCRALLSNRSPRDGARLRAHAGPVKGMRFTLTAPKCVSLLELLGIDERVGGAVKNATRACLDFVDLIAVPAGQTSDGSKPAPVVCYGAGQRLTDTPPRVPHRHIHFDVLSLAWHEERRQTTGAELGVLAHAGSLLQALFHHQLAWELGRLGYGIFRRGDAFAIEGFPEEVEDLFPAQRRSRQAKGYEFLPPGYFQDQQRLWRDILGAGRMAELQGLGRGSGRPVEPLSTEFEMSKAAHRLLAEDFFVPVDSIARGALLANLGRGPADIHALVRWVTGGAVSGIKARVFALRNRWCWGYPQHLEAEQNHLAYLRRLPLRQGSWLSPSAGSDAWWEAVLAEDTHPVAILRADLDTFDVETLRQRLDTSVLLCRDLREGPAQPVVMKWIGHLKRSGRVLILDDEKPKAGRPWLDTLPRCGVPVFRKRNTKAMKRARACGLDVSFCEGAALSIFVSAHSHRPNCHLLVNGDDYERLTNQVRELRASSTAAKHVLLAPAGKSPQPGLLAQFARNTGGIHATETLKILRLDAGQMVVERPSGLLAFVPREQWGDLTVYQPVDASLAAGDRIRLTRNIGPRAQANGLRGGRSFVVRAVADDGTAYLNGGRVLPPEAGHWDYDFCRIIEDGPPAGPCLALCSAADLPWVARHGWLRPRVKIIVCAATEARAEQVLREVIAGRSEACLPDTDEIGLKLAAESGLLPAVGEGRRPAPTLAEPAAVPPHEPMEIEPGPIPDTPDLEL